MRASVGGRDELATRVQQALALLTKREAEHIVNVVVSCIEATLLNNLGTDGFTLKLNSFGKFSVRHKRGILRKIPFTGKTPSDEKFSGLFGKSKITHRQGVQLYIGVGFPRHILTAIPVVVVPSEKLGRWASITVLW
jgi:nucleoid DNA-binding protein